MVYRLLEGVVDLVKFDGVDNEAKTALIDKLASKLSPDRRHCILTAASELELPNLMFLTTYGFQVSNSQELSRWVEDEYKEFTTYHLVFDHS